MTKHVTLISTLSNLVTKFNLLEVSELEQSIACTSNQQQDFKSLTEQLATPLNNDAKIRLVMLYALRYEKHPNSGIPLLIDTLGTVCGIPNAEVAQVYKLLSIAGQEHRMGDLFGDDVLTRTKQMFKPMKGIYFLF